MLAVIVGDYVIPKRKALVNSAIYYEYQHVGHGGVDDSNIYLFELVHILKSFKGF